VKLIGSANLMSASISSCRIGNGVSTRVIASLGVTSWDVDILGVPSPLIVSNGSRSFAAVSAVGSDAMEPKGW